MAKRLKLAFIIPTIGRFALLENLLNNIEVQPAKPDLVIIVDTGDVYSKDKIEQYALPIKYVYTGSNSLTEGRNTGIRNVPEGIDLIGFLDDDVILHKAAIEIMLDFWQKAPPDTGGVAFNIINNRRSRKFWPLKRMFFMGDRMPGNVLRSGYHTVVENVNIGGYLYTKYLPGGTTVWRREIFDNFQFDENLKGYGLCEDVDFSYRVGKEYKLIVLPEAKLIHKPHSVRHRKENINFGISEIVNRFHFINKHREFSRGLFYWASCGKLLENAFFGFITLNPGYLKRAAGNVLGIKRVFFNNNKGRL